MEWAEEQKRLLEELKCLSGQLEEVLERLHALEQMCIDPDYGDLCRTWAEKLVSYRQAVLEMVQEVEKRAAMAEELESWLRTAPGMETGTLVPPPGAGALPPGAAGIVPGSAQGPVAGPAPKMPLKGGSGKVHDLFSRLKRGLFGDRDSSDEEAPAPGPGAGRPMPPPPSPAWGASERDRPGSVGAPGAAVERTGELPSLRRCPACGRYVDAGNIFCAYCGRELDRPSAPAVSKVQFSAVAPKNLRRDEYALIHVVMYEDDFRSEVDRLIAEAEEPVGETRSGAVKAAEGSTVRVVLTSPDIEVPDGEEVRVWQGEYLDFGFAVCLPEGYAKSQVLFRAEVFLDDVIATRLKFVARCSAPSAQRLEVIREDVLSAFVSYASQDRQRVAAIIQGMRKVRPDLDVFFDVDSLRSGEDWERALHREIESRDIFYLCWSHFARQSKWVEAEWRYALACKGLDFIEPVPIEQPDVCPPPAELVQKHFNDKLLYIINSSGGAGGT